MKRKELELLNYQIIVSFIFIITLIISILLTFDEKQELLKKNRLFSKKFDRYLNLINRIISLLVILAILYINYNDYQIKRKKGINAKPSLHQIYASIFSVISATIVLYVVIENWYLNPNITSIENPTI